MLNFRTKTKLIVKGQERNLYQTKEGFRFWLDPSKYLDSSIIDKGVFEPKSTAIVKNMIKKGDVVFDVGANIGYYAVLFSKLVGKGGAVYCFEPTPYYKNILYENMLVNNITNCTLLDYGLSSSNIEADIAIGECSATLHWVCDNRPSGVERVKLKRLDDVEPTLGIKKLDFIKIDVDGHEPAFLQGAWNTLNKYDPIILLEVNHENYLEGGVTAWDFYDLLLSKGYFIYSENGLKKFESKRQFLQECGNFSYSANIIISRNELTKV